MSTTTTPEAGDTFEDSGLNRQEAIKLPDDSTDDVDAPVSRSNEDAGPKKRRMNLFIELLDGYGKATDPSKETDPRWLPKTAFGAVVSVSMRCLIIVLFVYNTYKLLQDYDQVRQLARPVVYNSFCKDATATSAKDYDIPSLQLQTQTEVIFFGQENHTLLKISVEDDYGYDSRMESSSNAVPVTEGVYNVFDVSLDSWDTNTNPVKSPVQGTTAGMKEMTNYADLRGFVETSSAIKHLVDKQADTQLYDYQAVLYTRFQQDVMQTKMCQLQVAMVNTGEYETLIRENALSPRFNQVKSRLPSLQTQSINWSPQSFKLSSSSAGYIYDAGSYNSIVLQDYYTSTSREYFLNNVTVQKNLATTGSSSESSLNKAAKDVGTPGFMDWKLLINYVNNFNATMQVDYCDRREHFIRNYVTVNAQNVTNKTTIRLGLVSNDNSVGYPSAIEFYVLMENMFAKEVVKASNFQVLTAHGSTRVGVNDLAGAFYQFDVVQPAQKEFYPTFTTAPVDWSCQTSLYNRGDGVCNCMCGTYDPDCLPAPYGFYNISVAANCNSSMPYCNVYGLCQETPSSVDVSVSETCRWSLIMAGETALNGFTGGEEMYRAGSGTAAGSGESNCKPCPGQSLYQGAAVEASEGKYLCSFKPTLEMDSRWSNNRVFGTSTLQNRSGSVTLKKMEKTGLPMDASTQNPITAFITGVPNTPEVKITSVQEVGTGRPDLQTAYITGNSGSGASSSQQVMAQGELISMIEYDSKEIYITMPNGYADDGYNWFWETGPYSLYILGIEYKISSATSIATAAATTTAAATIPGRHVQKLLLQCCLPVAEIGFKATLQSNIPISVNPTTIQAKSLALAAQLKGAKLVTPMRMMLMDNQGITTAESILVTSFVWQDISTGVFNLGVERILQSWSDSNTNLYCGTTTTRKDSTVYTKAMIKLDKYWESGDTYDPALRWKATKNEPGISPSQLKLETAFYIIPLGQGFHCADGYATLPDGRWPITGSVYLGEIRKTSPTICSRTGQPSYTALNLCPDMRGGKSRDRPAFRGFSWDDWTIRSSHQLNVTHCSLTSTFPPCLEPDNPQYTPSSCLKTNIPQWKLDFSGMLPINNKWNKSISTPEGIRNDLEYVISTSKVFHFTYSSSSTVAEHQWSHSMAKGDVTAEQNFMAYGGANEFIGPGKSTGRYHATAELMPADIPMLFEQVQIIASPMAVKDVLECTTTPKGWPSNPEEITSLIEEFDPIDLKWDISSALGNTFVALGDPATMEKGIPIEPGYGMLFSATLQISTQYEEDGADFDLKGWSFAVLSQNVVRYKLPLQMQNSFKVTYNINFDDSAYPLVTENYNVYFEAAVRYGAIFGFYILGLIILRFLNTVNTSVLSMYETSTINSIRSMRAINISDEGLRELIEYVGTVNGPNQAEMINIYHTKYIVGESALDTYNKMAQKIGKINLVLYQVMYYVSISKDTELKRKHEELVSMYKQERRKGPGCSFNQLWMDFWDVLGETYMYEMLYKILKKDYVDQYKKKAQSMAA